MKNKKGFTLIELLAVIIILGIILAIAVPRVLNVINTQKANAFEASVGMLAAGAKNAALSGTWDTNQTNINCAAEATKIPGIRYNHADYATCTYTVNVTTYEVSVSATGAAGGKYGAQTPAVTATR